MQKENNIENLKLSDVCNLSRLPIIVKNNPIYKAAHEGLQDNLNPNKINNVLIDHYDKLNFNSLNDLFDTNIQALAKVKHNTYFLPWYHIKPVAVVKDDAFITKLSIEKINEKSEKIINLINSIKKNGYVPDDFKDRKLGHITGYYLEDLLGNRKFYVVSGNHRVSSLTALGYEYIDHIFENLNFFKSRDKINFGYTKVPHIFSEKDVKTWPAVKSGFLTANEATDILRRYTEVR